MAALHIVFGREVFEIDQYRCGTVLRAAALYLLGKLLQIGIGGFAAKSFNDNAGVLVVGAVVMDDSNACCTTRSHPLQRGCIVDVQPHGHPTRCQVTGQAPAHAHIPIVIDDLTKIAQCSVVEQAESVEAGMAKKTKNCCPDLMK